MQFEDWNGDRRVRALHCLGFINKQNRSDMCTVCRKKKEYLKELPVTKKDAKPTFDHSYSNTPCSLILKPSVQSHKEPEPRQKDTQNGSPSTPMDSPSKDIEDSSTSDMDISFDSMNNDPTYLPSDEGADDESPEDLDQLVHKIIGSLCPSLETEQFIDLIKSQVGNTNLSDPRLRRWDPRFLIELIMLCCSSSLFLFSVYCQCDVFRCFLPSSFGKLFYFFP
jgi:hypothetical protein